MLIFLNGQVTFKCTWDATSREDILSELQIFGMEDYVYNRSTTSTILGGLDKKAGLIVRMTLPSLIQQYSRRQLSFQSDVLNAFAGLENFLRLVCDTELLYGLCRPTFGLSMLWYSGFLERRPQFPSWSWTGWIGMAVTGGEVFDDAKWITKYSWINWYHVDSETGMFLLMPQLGHTSGQSAERGEDAVMPQYYPILHKHDRAPGNGKDALKADDLELSPTRTVHPADLGLTITDLDIPNHTIYFQTLKGRVWMSAFDPSGCANEGTTHVHLYDSSFRYLGVAWINDLTFWAQAGFFEPDTVPTDPRWRSFPVDIALLSGPEKATTMTTQTLAWLLTEAGAGPADPDSSTFYRVILLSRLRVSDYSPLKSPCSYERIGMGEVLSDVVEGWDSSRLSWGDVLLQ